MICGTMSSVIASAHARLMRSNDSSVRSFRWAELEKCAARAVSDSSLSRAFLAGACSAAIRSRVAKTCGSMGSVGPCSVLRLERADGEQTFLAIGRERPELEDFAPGRGLLGGGVGSGRDVPGPNARLAGRPGARGVVRHEVAGRPDARDDEREVEDA